MTLEFLENLALFKRSENIVIGIVPGFKCVHAVIYALGIESEVAFTILELICGNGCADRLFVEARLDDLFHGIFDYLYKFRFILGICVFCNY